jgi:hypothetical protein
MDGWAFTKGRDGWRWHWMDPAGNLIKSSCCPLRTLVACVKDAMKHGYAVVLEQRVRPRDD